MIYEALLQKIAFPISSRLARRKFWIIYKDLLKSQWLSKSKIEAIQLKKLKMLVAHAYETVPLYKELMDKKKVKPQDILCLSDISKLPIVTKSDFRNGFPHRCTSKNISRKDWMMDSTSGSTGSPFQFIRDKQFSDMSLALTYRNYTWTGMNIGNKIVSIWGYHKPTIAIAAIDSLLRKKSLSSFNVEKDYLQYYHFIKKHKPYLIEAYSASVTHFAKLLKENNLKELHVPAVISSAETLYPKNRKLIEQTLHTKVFNRYGSREVGNVAHECEMQNGLHINAESYIVEVVSNSGKVINLSRANKKSALKGRLIVTNLSNYAMPFIRYDTQDYGVPSNKKCGCGRGLPMLASIDGRMTDFIVMPNGKELSFLFFNHYFEQYGAYLSQFQVVQDKKNHLTLKLVVSDKYSAKKEKELLDGIYDKVSRKMKITIIKVKTIKPERSGKTRPVKRLI